MGNQVKENLFMSQFLKKEEIRNIKTVELSDILRNLHIFYLHLLRRTK